MTVTLPSDWNPANGIWPGASMHPTVKDAVKQAATDLAALKTRCDTAMQTKLDALITAYNAHIGTAGVHIESDTANTITSTAATDPTADILTLANECYDDYEAHRVNVTDSVHGAADTTNVVSAANYPADTEAKAIALLNDIKAKYEAHRVLIAGSVHGAADSVNTITAANATDWDSAVTLANDIKATYNVHHTYITSSVHGAATDPNTVTSADSGAQITALYAELNEIKADYNLHVANLGVHPLAGTTESTTDASTEATAVALVNALKATLNTHFASATDHLDADTTTITAADSTEYEDILTLTAEVRADYEAHRVKTSIHTKADAVNTVSALGTGGAVTIGLVNA